MGRIAVRGIFPSARSCCSCKHSIDSLLWNSSGYTLLCCGELSYPDRASSSLSATVRILLRALSALLITDLETSEPLVPEILTP